jgi:heme-degrading monooxygenase HmoA
MIRSSRSVVCIATEQIGQDLGGTKNSGFCSSPQQIRVPANRHRHILREGPMIAVIFEVWPAQGRKDEYLEIAAALRTDLDRIDGFISIERFQSMSDPEKRLSLFFWRDEEAVKNWRNHSNHRRSQTKGRGGIFADYRLRVAAVARDYGLTERAEVPDDSRGIHDERHFR